jgi:hypothetical protein
MQLKVEILVKEFNDSYNDFEFKVNRKLENYPINVQVMEVDFLYDNKNIIAIIKYNFVYL